MEERGESVERVKGKRGGARPGAGRKKTTTAGFAMRIPSDVEAILAKVDNRSAFVVEAIRHYAAAQGINP